jgi:NAD kinase
MKALLVYKKSKLELLEERVAQFKPEIPGEISKEYLYLNHPLNKEKLQKAHDENKVALENVISELEKNGISYTKIWRGGDEMYNLTKTHDVVIACGGDGTFIDAARYITTQTPLIGVSSNPTHSIGYFCACNPQTLIQTLNKNEITTLPRMQVKYNGLALRSSYINDIVISKGIASFQRLGLTLMNDDQNVVTQKPTNLLNTGLLISTGAGSTAYMSNVGGTAFAVDSDELEYAELLIKRPKIGFANKIVVSVQDNDIAAYFDGDYDVLNLGFTDTLEFSMNGSPLYMFGNLKEKQQTYLAAKMHN